MKPTSALRRRSSLWMRVGLDTRINATVYNGLVTAKPIEWFCDNVIMLVPWPSQAFDRPVYPNFLQPSVLMSMNLEKHMTAHKYFYRKIVKSEGDSAEKHRDFYDDYLAIMHLTAEFYLQTI